MQRVFFIILVLLSVTAAPLSAQAAKAPGFTAKTADGDSVSLSDYLGKTVVLEWGNPDCPFVVKHYDSGNLPSLQKRYTERDVVWLVIMSSAKGRQGYYTSEEYLEWRDKNGAAMTEILHDHDGIIGGLYGARTTPEMAVINAKGELVYQGAIDSIPSASQEDIDRATNYVVEALEALAKGRKVKTSKTQPYGCSIKYKK